MKLYKKKQIFGFCACFSFLLVIIMPIGDSTVVFCAAVPGVVAVVFKFLRCWLHGRAVFLFCAMALIGRAPHGRQTHTQGLNMRSPRQVAFIFLAASLVRVGVARCQGSPGIVSARATAALNRCDANLAKFSAEEIPPMRE